MMIPQLFCADLDVVEHYEGSREGFEDCVSLDVDKLLTR